MKKITYSIFLLLAAIVPTSVFAAGKLLDGVDNALGVAESGGLYTGPLTDIIFNVIAFVLSLAATVALAALVWAGFLYISAFTNEDNVEKAKKIALWAVTGLIIMGASFMVLNIIRNVILK